MVYPATGGTPVGVGGGRRIIIIVGILIYLNLVMCLKTGMQLNNSRSTEVQGPGNGCGHCVQTAQKEHGESEVPISSVPKNGSKGEPVILDLLEDQDDRVCLKYDRMFCFSRNKEGVDPESKMKQVSQELGKQEAEMRKKKDGAGKAENPQ
ncbi:hypothetical protein DUI87_00586 [Hirundo rustica rustica]|uniref:Uncharacterized protein n=1 Tax=Hirundo rustica rustica TaxID=333673 RepID=A0A3M0LA64_HIRRU|nr:hypothetical protein DUI87_00586 [Hirundo rustica rustica]